MLNSKIIFGLVGVGVAVIVIVFSLQGFKSQEPQNEIITKGAISSTTTHFVLPANYTSADLLNYCTQDESLIYDDVCIRGLWDVADKCKNGNYTSINSICNDPKFGQFEEKVDKEMQDLNKSLTKILDSCMNVTSDNDVQACSDNIERIKNDCTDPRFYSMWSVCSDPKIDQFNDKYKETLSKLNPSG